VICDQHQNQGLGTRMCERLLDISRAAGMRQVVSLVTCHQGQNSSEQSSTQDR
jgi:L-amino acid N-acyltransferase YncA